MAKFMIALVLFLALVQSSQQQSEVKPPVNQPQQQTILSDLMRIPSHGIQLLKNTLTGIRNLLPGGRNGPNAPQDSQSTINGNYLPNPGFNGQQSMNQNLPTINQITQPISDAFRQSRIPIVPNLVDSVSNGVNDVSKGLVNGVSGISSGLTNGLNRITNRLPSNGNNNNIPLNGNDKDTPLDIVNYVATDSAIQNKQGGSMPSLNAPTENSN